MEYPYLIGMSINRIFHKYRVLTLMSDTRTVLSTFVVIISVMIILSAYVTWRCILRYNRRYRTTVFSTFVVIISVMIIFSTYVTWRCILRYRITVTHLRRLSQLTQFGLISNDTHCISRLHLIPLTLIQHRQQSHPGIIENQVFILVITTQIH